MDISISAKDIRSFRNNKKIKNENLIRILIRKADQFFYGIFPTRKANLKEIFEFIHYQDNHKTYQLSHCPFCH